MVGLRVWILRFRSHLPPVTFTVLRLVRFYHVYLLHTHVYVTRLPVTLVAFTFVYVAARYTVTHRTLRSRFYAFTFTLVTFWFPLVRLVTFVTVAFGCDLHTRCGSLRLPHPHGYLRGSRLHGYHTVGATHTRLLHGSAVAGCVTLHTFPVTLRYIVVTQFFPVRSTPVLLRFTPVGLLPDYLVLHGYSYYLRLPRLRLRCTRGSHFTLRCTFTCTVPVLPFVTFTRTRFTRTFCGCCYAHCLVHCNTVRGYICPAAAVGSTPALYHVLVTTALPPVLRFPVPILRLPRVYRWFCPDWFSSVACLPLPTLHYAYPDYTHTPVTLPGLFVTGSTRFGLRLFTAFYLRLRLRFVARLPTLQVATVGCYHRVRSHTGLMPTAVCGCLCLPARYRLPVALRTLVLDAVVTPTLPVAYLWFTAYHAGWILFWFCTVVHIPVGYGLYGYYGLPFFAVRSVHVHALFGLPYITLVTHRAAAPPRFWLLPGCLGCRCRLHLGLRFCTVAGYALVAGLPFPVLRILPPRVCGCTPVTRLRLRLFTFYVTALHTHALPRYLCTTYLYTFTYGLVIVARGLQFTFGYASFPCHCRVILVAVLRFTFTVTLRFPIPHTVACCGSFTRLFYLPWMRLPFVCGLRFTRFGLFTPAVAFTAIHLLPRLHTVRTVLRVGYLHHRGSLHAHARIRVWLRLLPHVTLRFLHLRSVVIRLTTLVATRIHTFCCYRYIRLPHCVRYRRTRLVLLLTFYAPLPRAVTHTFAWFYTTRYYLPRSYRFAVTVLPAVLRVVVLRFYYLYARYPRLPATVLRCGLLRYTTCHVPHFAVCGSGSSLLRLVTTPRFTTRFARLYVSSGWLHRLFTGCRTCAL